MYMNRTLNRVLAAAVASAGFAVPVPTTAATLSCTSASFTATSDGNGNINVSCTQAGTTAGTCSISVSPTVLPAAGGKVSVSSNCGANTSLAGGKSVAANGSNSWTDTIGANGLSTNVSYTYTVTGDGGTRSATVTQSGTGGGTSPPPGGPISCAGFSRTHVIDINWGATASAAPRVLTGSYGGFTKGDIVVARFTTPPSTAPSIFAQIKSAEWGDQQHQRIASLAASPCEFSTGLGRLATTGTTTSPAINYAVGGSSTYYAILKPSTTYYFNIKNVDCAAGESCNMFIELQKPKGL